MKLGNGVGTVYKLQGNRRNPYIVRKTVGWDVDPESGIAKQKYITIGYAPTKAKGLEMLMDYNKNPYDIDVVKITFAEVYQKWSDIKFSTISQSNINGYNAAYRCCEKLHDKIFKDIKLYDLQSVVDNCGKNYPTLKKLKILFNQLYEYALKYDICNKNYSKHIDIAKYKNKNPNKINRTPFTKKEIELLWIQQNNPYIQIVLILIYSGVRISELLDLKTENVHLDELYFDIIKSKTESGIRKVPIANKVFQFFKTRVNENCEYLLHTTSGEKFQYRNYYDSYWKPAMELINSNHKPHDTRHTCISMLAEANINPTTIKNIVGHAGAMSLTERVYTHLNIEELVNAINKI